jgi:transcriptional antiterminator RfaH
VVSIPGETIRFLSERMLITSDKEQLKWFVIHTQPQQEARAEDNLKTLDVETFFPISSQRRFRANRRKPQILKPLFPRYIFARFVVSDLLHKVRFTRGVNDVVSCGGKPAPVDNEIIWTIKSRVGADGTINFDEQLQPGMKVKIEDGPFKDFSAIFERKLKGSDRVMLLLQAIKYEVRVVVESEYVRKLKEP